MQQVNEQELKPKREILFKAKRVDNGEWIEGYYVYRPDTRNLIYLPAFDGSSLNTYFHVDPKTVCQFTGLLDVKGNKVFEGDIVKIQWGEYVIQYNPEILSFGLVVKAVYDCGILEFIGVVRTMLYKVQVTGNIHD